MRMNRLLMFLLPLTTFCRVPSPDPAAGNGPAPPPRWEVAFDFAQSLAGERVKNPFHASSSVVSIGGQTKTALFQHPNAPGQPLAAVVFREVSLPPLRAGERLLLTFAVGIREGFSKEQNPQADGCRFALQVDGKEVFGQPYDRQRWKEERIDLSAHAGRKVDIAFLTDPLQNSAYDWAVWGNPRILIEGRKAKTRPIPAVSLLKLSALIRQPAASRIVERKEDRASSVTIAVMDRHLDLAAQLKEFAPQARASGPAGPPLVVGEGEDPHNHTVIRVLNRFGIADVQFLAYPSSVRGGVSVNAGTFAGMARCIVAAPLTDAVTREIRLFNTRGGLMNAFMPDRRLSPPFVIAVGNYLPGHPGDEIAVASRRLAAPNRPILLYNGRGVLLKRLSLQDGSERADTLTLTTKHDRSGDRILAFLPVSHRLVLLDPVRGTGAVRDLPFLGADQRLYETAFDPDSLIAAGPEDTFSTITRILPSGRPETLDVGQRENVFWIQWYGPGFDDLPDGRYVRKSLFRHLRTDGASPGAANPDLSRDPNAWAGEEFRKGFEGIFSRYDTDLPSLWEPCFTHRQHKGRFQAWRDAIDPLTGLPKYMMLTRNNRPVEYGEFGSVDFNASTYACGLLALDNLYILPLRAFLRRLNVHFRRNPEHFVALEPNHEHEIAVEAEGTMGDYNPRMIEGFYRYLTDLYGRDLNRLNRRFGTPFADYFDAPRQWDRGGWDDYATTNPFFAEWIAYNRYVVNRRLAETFREALLAGFPPEIVKCHQIPDTYAIGNLAAFSSVTSRFTPIDYALNAGTGYGFTRYGVWYNREHDALQDAHAAGFDMMSLGEYQALTPDKETAFQQLRFIQERGGYSVHCMLWPEGHDRGFNASMDEAIRRLMRLDSPKPGVTGGVGEARAYRNGPNRCDIVCIGTGAGRTGLLKSVREDGSWEGTVYVVPFHAHVDIQPIPMRGAIRNGRGKLACSPLRGLDSGSQIEITFQAQAKGPSGSLSFRVLRGDQELPGLRSKVSVTRDRRFYRYLLRVPLPVEGIRIEIVPQGARSRTTVEGLRAMRHTEQTPKLTKGIFTGQRHRGGVTFDIL